MEELVSKFKNDFENERKSSKEFIKILEEFLHIET